MTSAETDPGVATVGSRPRLARALVTPVFGLLRFLLHKIEHICDDQARPAWQPVAPAPRPDWPHPVMRSEQMNVSWVKSSLSFSNGNCVEAAEPIRRRGRDSRQPRSRRAGPEVHAGPNGMLPHPSAARGSRPVRGIPAHGRLPLRRPGCVRPGSRARSCPWSGSTWWRCPRRTTTRRSPPSSPTARARPDAAPLPAETVEFPVPHAAEKSVPLIRREPQDGPGRVPAVANADLATGQARHLDAVAVGVTQGALDPVRT